MNGSEPPEVRNNIIRYRCHFAGTVQGVGFRPFIYRIAQAHRLAGFVRNSLDGVIAEVEGPEGRMEDFLHELDRSLPPLARITSFVKDEIVPQGDDSFHIIESDCEGKPSVHITADTATCDACLKELFDPSDRRYRYPFINCTNCGPRLTIVRTVPYDRENTAMAPFPLCPQCREEYGDPADRRFHAEPNACRDCGPRLSLLDGCGSLLSTEDPLADALEVLTGGGILALKGLGGFHLACDAANDRAVERLRILKYREAKPLALMVRDIERAELFVDMEEADRALLLSPERPIVLIRKKHGAPLSPSIAPGMKTLGLMLPYTPLHHLLLDGPLQALVMTSGNRTDEPISIANDEAVLRLGGIADRFLVHNRDILVRCDDSVAAVMGGKPVVLRRSRGYVPRPIELRKRYPSVLALGGHMKTTICITKGRYAFFSPHIGDMGTPQARDFHRESIALMQEITHAAPHIVACDCHPGYYTTRKAREMAEGSLIEIQHHHAHIVSCMAEHGLTEEVIGLAMDGTGFGTDGEIWGGEFLLAREGDFMRMGHFKYLPLPGAEAAVREPWRMAASLLRDAFGSNWQEIARSIDLSLSDSHLEIIDRIMEKNIQCPLTSSLGRLFDGAASIAGIRRRADFEGQAPMELEALAERGQAVTLPYEIVNRGPVLIVDPAPAIRRLVAMRLEGRAQADMAASFQQTVVAVFLAMAEEIRRHTGRRRIVLSGGCFQNRSLTGKTVSALERAEFEVYTHALAPPNDGGLALGQAVAAAAKLEQ